MLESDKAVARPGGAEGVRRPLAILRCCPVDAIGLTGAALPSPGETVTRLPLVPGWEAAWERQRDQPENVVERERRYGRAWSLETMAQGWRWRIELPRGIPNSRWFAMHGIPNEPPEYDFAVDRLGPQMLSLRAWLTDVKLRFLAGKTNSFPVSLRADAYFPAPIGTYFRRFDGAAVEVYAFRDGTADPRAALRDVLLSGQ